MNEVKEIRGMTAAGNFVEGNIQDYREQWDGSRITTFIGDTIIMPYSLQMKMPLKTYDNRDVFTGDHVSCTFGQRYNMHAYPVMYKQNDKTQSGLLVYQKYRIYPFEYGENTGASQPVAAPGPQVDLDYDIQNAIEPCPPTEILMINAAGAYLGSSPKIRSMCYKMLREFSDKIVQPQQLYDIVRKEVVQYLGSSQTEDQFADEKATIEHMTEHYVDMYLSYGIGGAVVDFLKESDYGIYDTLGNPGAYYEKSSKTVIEANTNGGSHQADDESDEW